MYSTQNNPCTLVHVHVHIHVHGPGTVHGAATCVRRAIASNAAWNWKHLVENKPHLRHIHSTIRPTHTTRATQRNIDQMLLLLMSLVLPLPWWGCRTCLQWLPRERCTVLLHRNPRDRETSDIISRQDDVERQKPVRHRVTRRMGHRKLIPQETTKTSR